jgi:hypothetical protein
MKTKNTNHVFMRNDAGEPRLFDMSSGRTFSMDGTEIVSERMIPAKDEYDVALSDYAYNYCGSTIAGQLGRKKIVMPEYRKVHTDDGPAAVKCGERVVTMDLGIADVHIDAALPNYAAGYRLSDPVADVAAPPIVVGHASNWFYTWDDVNAFKRVLPNGGAAGGATPEINPTKSNTNYSTKPYALGAFIPTEVETNSDAPLRPFQKAVRRVMDALMLEREIRVATLLRTSGSWNTNNVIALGAATKWNGGAAADPVRNLLSIIEASAMRPTAIIMSELVANDFRTNAAVKSYIGFKDKDPALPDLSEFTSILKLPRMIEAPMKYYASGSTFSYVWGGDVVLVREPPEMPPTSQEDVATATTFRWMGGDAPDGTQQGGWLVRTFFMQDRGPRGGRKVVVAHNDAEAMTSGLVGGLITGAHT